MEFEQKASCRLVCRPNRTRIRHFNEKDLKRIAKAAVEDGADPIKILAGVFVATGFGVLVCKVNRALSLLAAIREASEAIAVIIASSALLNFIIKSVGGQLIKVLPLVRLITAVFALQELMFAFFGKDSKGTADVLDFLEVLEFIDKICSAVKLDNK